MTSYVGQAIQLPATAAVRPGLDSASRTFPASHLMVAEMHVAPVISARGVISGAFPVASVPTAPFRGCRDGRRRTEGVFRAGRGVGGNQDRRRERQANHRDLPSGLPFVEGCPVLPRTEWEGAPGEIGAGISKPERKTVLSTE